MLQLFLLSWQRRLELSFCETFPQFLQGGCEIGIANPVPFFMRIFCDVVKLFGIELRPVDILPVPTDEGL